MKTPEALQEERRQRLEKAREVLVWVALALGGAAAVYVALDRLANPPRAGVPVRSR